MIIGGWAQAAQRDQTLVVKRMNRDVAEAIAAALLYLQEVAPADAYANPCYREIRNNRWHELQAIAAKTATILEQGGAPAFTPAELELAAAAVDCAAALKAEDTEEGKATIGTVATVAGLAATALGLITFFG